MLSVDTGIAGRVHSPSAAASVRARRLGEHAVRPEWHRFLHFLRDVDGEDPGGRGQVAHNGGEDPFEQNGRRRRGVVANGEGRADLDGLGRRASCSRTHNCIVAAEAKVDVLSCEVVNWVAGFKAELHLYEDSSDLGQAPQHQHRGTVEGVAGAQFEAARKHVVDTANLDALLGTPPGPLGPQGLALGVRQQWEVDRHRRMEAGSQVGRVGVEVTKAAAQREGGLVCAVVAPIFERMLEPLEKSDELLVCILQAVARALHHDSHMFQFVDPNAQVLLLVREDSSAMRPMSTGAGAQTLCRVRRLEQ
mmetsp:Transcript_77122/g.223172  ORF Transcript_77122/g.223172 Transcript_77122/m.223172 type:complete len:306 (-) Transcript_77122:793-1710(-)